jgi:hypothetical protein
MAKHVDVQRAKTTLDSMLTDYDRRISKRDPNTYRLGHLFGASDRVFEGLQGDVPTATIEKRVQRFFIVSDMPPARNFLKLLADQPEGGSTGIYLEGWPKTKKKTAKKTKATKNRVLR